MADTVKTSNDIIIDTMYVDGDTRKITLKNPKESIPSSVIESIGNYLATSQVLIGDQTGAAFGRINTVITRAKTTTTLDLS